VVEGQKREALEAQRRHDETVVKLRQEAAARMREAALSRHQLLQQVEALTTRNGSSDSAMVMCTRYIAQNSLGTFSISFPVDGEVANLLRTCYGETTGKLCTCNG